MRKLVVLVIGLMIGASVFAKPTFSAEFFSNKIYNRLMEVALPCSESVLGEKTAPEMFTATDMCKRLLDQITEAADNGVPYKMIALDDMYMEAGNKSIELKIFEDAIALVTLEVGDDFVDYTFNAYGLFTYSETR